MSVFLIPVAFGTPLFMTPVYAYMAMLKVSVAAMGCAHSASKFLLKRGVERWIKRGVSREEVRISSLTVPPVATQGAAVGPGALLTRGVEREMNRGVVCHDLF